LRDMEMAIEKGGFGGFTINMAMPDVSGFNDHLRSHNIPEMNGRFLGIGGVGFALVNRILIGGGGYGAKEVVESDSIRSEFTISSGEFKIGYALITSRYFNGAVNLGIGGVGYTLSLRPMMGDVQFDSLLVNPQRYVDMETNHFLLHPEAIAVISIPFKPISFFHIALRGGINLNIFTQEWTYDKKRVLNVPDVGAVTPVFSINFLFGGGI